MAYEEFVQDLAQIFHDVCKSNFLQLELIVSNMDPDSLTYKGISDYYDISGCFFDRICTGIASDIVGTGKLLQSTASFLNNENPFATILTFHRTWRMKRKENKQR